MVPGRKFSARTSAFASSGSRTRIASAAFRSSVRLSLLRLMLRKYALSAPTKGGPHARVSSPRPGCSTLMTRAPMSPSSIVQYGPERTRVKSSTTMPASGGCVAEAAVTSVSSRCALRLAHRVERVADQVERPRQGKGITAEPDSQVAVHLEVVAGDHQDARFVAQPLRERGRADGMRVANERDGAGVRRRVPERGLAPLDPAPENA